LRIVGTAYDTYLSRILIAATQFIEQETRVSLAATDPSEVPELLKQAILLIAGHLFENREGAIDRRIDEIPLGVQRIIYQFISPEAV